jgi:segregation and condensation protein B
MTDGEGLVPILEAALLAAGKPLTVAALAGLFEEHERPDNDSIRQALGQIGERCDGRGFELIEVASGWRFQVREQYSPWVGRLWQERPQKYSRALLETLALVAYRQPITRGEIEEIRGVAVSTNIIRTLHERDWIRVVGHRDVPGRPAMYATTRQFLDYFNLKSLDQLPALADLRDLETLNAELGFEPLQADEEDAAGAGGEVDAENEADAGAEEGLFAEVDAEVASDVEGVGTEAASVDADATPEPDEAADSSSDKVTRLTPEAGDESTVAHGQG